MAVKAMLERANAVENLILNSIVEVVVGDWMIECLNEKLNVMMRIWMEWILARLYIWSVTVFSTHVQYLKVIL
jgi:hypothetical protein